MRAYNRIELEKVARETGFIRDNLEKVIRLTKENINLSFCLMMVKSEKESRIILWLYGR